MPAVHVLQQHALLPAALLFHAGCCAQAAGQINVLACGQTMHTLYLCCSSDLPALVFQMVDELALHSMQ